MGSGKGSLCGANQAFFPFMLIDELRKRALTAAKAKDTVATTIYRLAISEVQTLEARAGGTLAEADALATVRKLVKSNEETLTATTDADKRAVLEREIGLLRELLPSGPSAADVTAALAPVVDAIRAAGNDGAATGVAMKHLKSQGVAADGQTVSAVVRSLRS